MVDAAGKSGGAGRTGGRGRGRVPKVESSGREGDGSGGRARGRGDGGRKEGGRRAETETRDSETGGFTSGKYHVVGLVSLNGQERLAFLEHCLRIPLAQVLLPAIPAFPDPASCDTASREFLGVASKRAARDSARPAADIDPIALSSSLSALALTGESHNPTDVLSSAACPSSSEAPTASETAVTNVDLQMEGVEIGLEAYQDEDAHIIYLFLPYPDAELGAMPSNASYYSQEQKSFRWECQVLIIVTELACLRHLLRSSPHHLFPLLLASRNELVVAFTLVDLFTPTEKL
jgi:hypothetical protein